MQSKKEKDANRAHIQWKFQQLEQTIIEAVNSKSIKNNQDSILKYITD
jgi:hypothetical protein